MKPFLFLILISLGAAVFVAGQLKARGAENPVDHIKPDRIKPSHEIARKIVASIRRKLNGRN